MPSEKFSARLSIAARLTPASSRRSGSRPTICDTALRPAMIPPLSSASATAFTWLPRLRWATRLEAAMAVKSMPRGRRPNRRSMTKAIVAGTVTMTTNAATPQMRRTASVSVARLRLVSRKDISLPIQITGWPILRTSRSG
ncbi:hypothetical protein D9M69_602130 [compost metagenome]